MGGDKKMEKTKLEERLQACNTAEEVFNEFIERTMSRLQSQGEAFGEHVAQEVEVVARHYMQKLLESYVKHGFYRYLGQDLVMRKVEGPIEIADIQFGDSSIRPFDMAANLDSDSERFQFALIERFRGDFPSDFREYDFVPTTSTFPSTGEAKILSFFAYMSKEGNMDSKASVMGGLSRDDHSHIIRLNRDMFQALIDHPLSRMELDEVSSYYRNKGCVYAPSIQDFISILHPQERGLNGP